MPVILSGNLPSYEFSSFMDKDHKYKYPEGLDLRPNSALHRKLRDEILRRALESHEVMSKRFDSWNEMDRLMTAYIQLDEDETKVLEKDPRKPVSIVYPYSYAIMDTILTYLVAAFWRDPIFRYEGVGPEDTVGAILLEKVISLQCDKFKVGLNLYVQFRDAIKYGIGVVTPSWETLYGTKVVEQSNILTDALGFITGREKRKVRERGIIFEGNALQNIDPYRYLPDPNVASHEAQKGEFVGWLADTNYMKLLADERDSDGDLFNVKYLRDIRTKTSFLVSDDQSARNEKFGGYSTKDNQNTTNPITILPMYIDLIPKEWKLGKSEYPEKWLFTLANDQVIISARRADFDHDMYPVAIASPEFDGYTATPMSRLEMLYGLQGFADWLINSHMANVRKAVNDMFVVDPYLVNIADLKDPKPGKLIRMRRPAWGKGVKEAVMQLNTTDVTRGNIADLAFVQQAMNLVGAADETSMGALRQGGPERLTRAEFQGTRFGSVSRLERIAKMIGMQSMQDIGYMFASNTQQLMEEETYIRITGEWQDELKKVYGDTDRVLVTPDSLSINFDMRVRDGSVPGGNFSELWINMFDKISANPALLQTFDIGRIFLHIATNLGAKNASDFLRNANITAMPDQQVMNQAQSGQVIPLQGRM